MKILYYNPKDKEVCYYQQPSGDFVIDNLETFQVKKSSEHYVTSHMWNGGSPYIPVNIEVEFLDDLKAHPAILDLNMVHEFQMMLNLMSLMRDPQVSSENRKQCRNEVLSMLNEIEKEVSEVKYED